jgi:uncharacterized protein
MRSLFLAAVTVAIVGYTGLAPAQQTEQTQADQERACEQGDAAMCGRAAVSLIGLDTPRARNFLERGCAGSDHRSCGALGLMLVSGEEGGRDYTRAGPLLGPACDEGLGAACGALSNMLFLGVGVPADQGAALARAERGCSLDDPRSCAALGLYLSAGDVFPRDLTRAAPALVTACVASSPNACAILENAATLAVQGADPHFQRSAGLDLFNAACAGGQPRSCGALGAFLTEGLFSPPDLGRAATAFERGCSLNHAVSCASIAEAYRTGHGVPRDDAQASEFANRALAIDPNNSEASRTLRRLR